MKITLLLIQTVLFNHLLGQNNFNIDPSILRDPTGYKVRYGDSLRINLRGEPECSGEFIINREGKVRLTYIGDVMVVGLNTRAIEALLIKKYQSELIFRNPTINVFVVNYSERVVFLTGSVNRQGPYTFPPEVEAMNIVEVISRAGGFSEIARKNKVYVTRTFHDENGNAVKTETYTVDVEALSKGLVKFGSSKKFWIYPGDRIEVPERLI
ncbi:MAG: polysaccharide biosynthesis/export family protein [Verrucomicrobiota bacterium]|nr:polysaccharide biosynthesis/export family protein [Verrucomicrobiota bacterium]